MNLILISEKDIQFSTDEEDEDNNYNFVKLKGRQMNHCLQILKVQIGSTLQIGVCNGNIGTAIVMDISDLYITLKIPSTLHKINTYRELIPYLCGPTIDVLMAIPRPKAVVKVLQTSACLGIRRLIFVCSERVEISYLSSPKFTKKEIKENLKLGLEQGISTVFPDVYLFASWKSLINSLQNDIYINKNENIIKIIAHPSENQSIYTIKQNIINNEKTYNKSFLLAIGPEGGWIPSELKELKNLNFLQISFGKRIFKSETALIYSISQIQLLFDNILPCFEYPPSIYAKEDERDEDGILISLSQRYINK